MGSVLIGANADVSGTFAGTPITSAEAVFATPAAPSVGGRIYHRFPRPRGIKKLATFRKKVDVLGNPATLSDVSILSSQTDAGAYGDTQLQFSGNGNFLYLPLAANGTATDCTNGTIRLNFRPGPNFFQGGGVSLRFYSDGSPSSPSANYTDVNLYSLRGIYSTQSASLWGRQQTLNLPGYAVANLNSSNDFVTRPSGTGANMAAVTYVGVSVSVGAACQCSFGDVEFIPNTRTKAACILTWDDGHLSQYTIGLPIMSRYNAPSVMMVGTPAVDVGASGRVSLQQLRLLQDVHGWQIASQAWTTEQLTDLAAMTEDQRSAYYSKLRNWHLAGGFMGGHDGSYYSNVGPGEPTQFTALHRHFRTLRTFNGANSSPQAAFPFGGEPQHFDPYGVRALNIGSGRFNVTNGYLNQIKPVVDLCALNKGVLVLAGHNDLTTSQVATNLNDLCADISSRSDIEILTMDEYVRSLG